MLEAFEFVTSAQSAYETSVQPPVVQLPGQLLGNRATLVLDLDDTLTLMSLNRIKDRRTGRLLQHDCTVSAHGVPNEKGYVYFRPFVRSFLEAVSKVFEVVLFTAACQEYADQILDKLDPDRSCIHFRLYRHHCTEFVAIPANVGESRVVPPELAQRVYVKDLRVLGRDLKRTVLVDNSLYCMAFQLSNGILANPYEGNHHSDKELLYVMATLQGLVMKEDSDFRLSLDALYGLPNIISDYRRYVGGPELEGAQSSSLRDGLGSVVPNEDAQVRKTNDGRARLSHEDRGDENEKQSSSNGGFSLRPSIAKGDAVVRSVASGGKAASVKGSARSSRQTVRGRNVSSHEADQRPSLAGRDRYTGERGEFSTSKDGFSTTKDGFSTTKGEFSTPKTSSFRGTENDPGLMNQASVRGIRTPDSKASGSESRLPVKNGGDSARPPYVQKRPGFNLAHMNRKVSTCSKTFATPLKVRPPGESRHPRHDVPSIVGESVQSLYSQSLQSLESFKSVPTVQSAPSYYAPSSAGDFKSVITARGYGEPPQGYRSTGNPLSSTSSAWGNGSSMYGTSSNRYHSLPPTYERQIPALFLDRPRENAFGSRGVMRFFNQFNGL